MVVGDYSVGHFPPGSRYSTIPDIYRDEMELTIVLVVSNNNGKVFTTKSLEHFNGGYAAMMSNMNHYLVLSVYSARARGKESTFAMPVAASGELLERKLK